MRQVHDSVVQRTAFFFGRLTGTAVATFVLASAVAGVTVAGPPDVQLDPPFYSFDGASPTVTDDIGITADDILRLTANPNPPEVAVDGANLGIAPGDELDALSSGNSGLDPNQRFLLLYSMDRPSVASAPPDNFLAEHGVPFNALDQAKKQHGAGDQFMALDLFTRAAGPVSATPGARIPSTSVQLRNQYNEGGTDFGGVPKNGSGAQNAGRGIPPDQDNVVSMMLTGRSAGGLAEVYFSIKAQAGVGGGADIFFNPDPTTGGPTTLYALSSELGLSPVDDIDAMIVFDTNVIGVYDPGDQVLFSLAPDSPALLAIPDVSAVGAAADVFTVSPGAVPTVFASAANLGLGAIDDQGRDNDDTDALDYVVCVVAGNPNPSERDCALQYGIRGSPPIPAASDWGLVILALFVLVAGTVVIRRSSHRTA